MNFNEHSGLAGLHAYLSPSKYHWINYDDEKFVRTYHTYLAAQRGTELHELACQLIKQGVKLQKNQNTLNLYVNDAIGFKMKPEQVLYYSANAFGTADAISFKKDFLRIHDLKTGTSRVSMHQLEIYAALFCLEYDVKPSDIQMEFRIYQSSEVLVDQPEPNDIFHVMDKIVTFDKLIEQLKMEEV